MTTIIIGLWKGQMVVEFIYKKEHAQKRGERGLTNNKYLGVAKKYEWFFKDQ